MSQSFTWPASSGGGGGGDATAANQVLQIAQETAINTNTNEISTNTLIQTQTLAADGAAAPTLATVVAGATSGGITQVLETNASGQLSITDGGGSITVDGTVAISGSVAVTGPLTDAELRASPVPVSTGGLTDAQLRATPVPVSGTVSTGGLTDAELRATAVPVSLTSTTITGSVAVTGPLTDAQLRATAVPVSLTSTTIAGSATATLSNVSSSATNVTVLASNANRKMMMVTNDSTASLYLKFGTTASTTSYTVLIPPQGYYEMPNPGLYTGIIDGIWSAANGSARVTEIT